MPMLICWAVLLAVLVAIAVTSFGSQGLEAFEVVVGALFGAFTLLPDSLLPRGPDGSIELSTDEFVELIGWSWVALSVAAMVINWLVGDRLRPKFLESLGGRLKTAAIAAGLVSIALIAIRLLVPENFNGPFLSWLPTLIGMPLIVWIVSAYSLCVSAILTLLDKSVVSQIDVDALR